jgi:hypothetical protein
MAELFAQKGPPTSRSEYSRPRQDGVSLVSCLDVLAGVTDARQNQYQQSDEHVLYASPWVGSHMPSWSQRA